MKAAVLMGLFCLGSYLWWDPGSLGFHIREVEVSGTSVVEEAVITELISSFVGLSFGLLACREIEETASQHPLILHAKARRRGLATIEVIVQERELVAWAEYHGPVGIDLEGTCHTGIRVPRSLPFLQSWAPQDTHWLSALALLQRIAANGADMLVGARVLGPPNRGALRVRLVSPPLQLVLPCPDDPGLEDRLASLRNVLADARHRGETPSYADLRWSNQIIIRLSSEERET